jgi:hypothetical protein
MILRRGLKAPAFVIVDGAPGLEKALDAFWPNVCTVRKADRSTH